jgi:hypothetical protein
MWVFGLERRKRIVGRAAGMTKGRFVPDPGTVTRLLPRQEWHESANHPWATWGTRRTSCPTRPPRIVAGAPAGCNRTRLRWACRPRAVTAPSQTFAQRSAFKEMLGQVVGFDGDREAAVVGEAGDG